MTHRYVVPAVGTDSIHRTAAGERLLRVESKHFSALVDIDRGLTVEKFQKIELGGMSMPQGWGAPAKNKPPASPPQPPAKWLQSPPADPTPAKLTLAAHESKRSPLGFAITVTVATAEGVSIDVPALPTANYQASGDLAVVSLPDSLWVIRANGSAAPKVVRVACPQKWSSQSGFEPTDPSVKFSLMGKDICVLGGGEIYIVDAEALSFGAEPANLSIDYAPMEATHVQERLIGMFDRPPSRVRHFEAQPPLRSAKVKPPRVRAAPQKTIDRVGKKGELFEDLLLAIDRGAADPAWKGAYKVEEVVSGNEIATCRSLDAAIKAAIDHFKDDEVADEEQEQIDEALEERPSLRAFKNRNLLRCAAGAGTFALLDLVVAPAHLDGGYFRGVDGNPDEPPEDQPPWTFAFGWSAAAPLHDIAVGIFEKARWEAPKKPAKPSAKNAKK